LPPLAVHEPTRRRKKNQWTGWVWNGFLLSSSAVTCKNKKKHKQSFSSFSFFSDLFLPAPFSDLQIFSFFFLGFVFFSSASGNCQCYGSNGNGFSCY
jgi:hypothetical protein